MTTLVESRIAAAAVAVTAMATVAVAAAAEIFPWEFEDNVLKICC